MSPRAASPAGPTISFCLPGGSEAPKLARQSILSQLDQPATRPWASDAALLVSELVTNSVLHAHIGADQTLTVEMTTLDDRLHIAVIDAGSEDEPHIVAPDPRVSGGFGLLLVNKLSSAWGVLHDAGGLTRVWFELLLERDKTPRAPPRVTAASISSASVAGRHPGAGVAR